MKRFLILEEFEQIQYEDIDEVFEQLQPHVVGSPDLELIPGSGLYRVQDGTGEKTSFYVLQVTVEDEPEEGIFHECEMTEFLKEALNFEA